MNLTTVISKVSDGNMLDSSDKLNKNIINNRRIFLEKNNIDIDQATRISTIYEGSDYRRYREVSNKDKGAGMYNGNVVTADALVTKKSNHALFLPIADCIGAVIFDPIKQILMLSHLGRHAIEQNGGLESIRFLENKYGCKSDDLLIFLTPAPGKDVYPLFAFENRSLKSVVVEQLQSAGVLLSHIKDNPSDTSKDSEYFSHSEFLKGNRKEDGRFAVVAMIRK